ncbi:MAG: hypothetical protein HY619_03250 [Thaumarchaeota archaeon]|nr:hypothetical protein [Nitrososphaerota archaeon]
MKTYLKDPLSLGLILVLLNGCAASMVRQRYRDLEVAQNIKLDAWNTAITQSASYCKGKPRDCRTRLIKLTAWISREDDWYPLFMPPYLKTIEFYETYLRDRAPTVLPMDERFLGELKVMAYLADTGVISDDEARRLVTSALRNLGANIQREAQGLVSEYQVALRSDNQMHQSILAGLAAGLLTAAVAATVPPTPVSPPAIQTFTITDFSRGRMYNCHSTPNQITCF